MRKFALAVFAAVFAAEIFAAPFVTPDMIRRNGLTDEQYETLWKMGKSPRIDIGTMRQLMFRANRYGNVTNWLDICGKTNDFAKLSFKLQGDNFQLKETNTVLVATNGILRVECARWKDYAAELEPDAKKQKDLEKAAKKFGKNLDKERKNFEKYRDKAGTQEERDFWQTLLDVLPVPNTEGK